MGLMRQLARKTKAAVLLLQHPNQAGMKEGTGTSGSGHWNNAARSRLYFSGGALDRGAGRDRNEHTFPPAAFHALAFVGIIDLHDLQRPHVVVIGGASASADDIFMRCVDAIKTPDTIGASRGAKAMSGRAKPEPLPTAPSNCLPTGQKASTAFRPPVFPTPLIPPCRLEPALGWKPTPLPTVISNLR
jgi:hypothetical protein